MLKEVPLLPLFKTVFSSHFSLPFPLTYTDLSLKTDLSFIWPSGRQNDDEELRKRVLPRGIDQRFLIPAKME